MTASYEHPSLRTPVTSQQRDQAEHYLQTAYADGRLGEAEFDRRIGQVIQASSRKELNDAFYGLVDVPSGPRPGGLANSSRNHLAQQSNQGTAGGAVAHVSGLVTSFVGPAVGYAMSPQGSPARRESAKAFNFQLISIASLVIAEIIHLGLPGLMNFIIGLMTIAWVTLTIVGAVKAGRGENWQNPVKKAVKVNVLPEK
jgi:uncharacterized Tic20 family protein